MQGICIQELHADIEAQLGTIKSAAPRYSYWTRFSVILSILHRSMCFVVDNLFVAFYCIILPYMVVFLFSVLY